MKVERLGRLTPHTSGQEIAPGLTVSQRGENLVLTASNALRQEIQEELTAGKPGKDILVDLFDRSQGNGGYEFVGDISHLGLGLTNAPGVFNPPVAYTDAGDITWEPGGKSWWFPDYMVKDPAEELATTGEVVFDYAGLTDSEPPHLQEEATSRRLGLTASARPSLSVQRQPLTGTEEVEMMVESLINGNIGDFKRSVRTVGEYAAIVDYLLEMGDVETLKKSVRVLKD